MNESQPKPTDEKRMDEPTPAAQQTEEEMREAYRIQQARLACPGCGETPFLG